MSVGTPRYGLKYARRCGQAGWRNYSLFLADDGTLIGYLECEDFAAAQAAMAATEVNARWQQEMAEFFGGAVTQTRASVPSRRYSISN